MIKDESYLPVVSITYEVGHGEYAYRLIKDTTPEGKTRVIVRRLAMKSTSGWSHGVSTQLLDANTMKFNATICVQDRLDFDSVIKALMFIESYSES